MSDERTFTLADQETLEPGYYWIRRNEPDGPPEWEIARFDGRAWWIAGSGWSHLPTRSADASNAWKIGVRIAPRRYERLEEAKRMLTALLTLKPSIALDLAIAEARAFVEEAH